MGVCCLLFDVTCLLLRVVCHWCCVSFGVCVICCALCVVRVELMGIMFSVFVCGVFFVAFFFVCSLLCGDFVDC